MNEFQAAYELSKLEFGTDSQSIEHAEMIADAKFLGLFVVVCEAAAYCPFTDATMPYPHRFLHDAFPTVEEALTVAAEENASDETGEAWYIVESADGFVHPVTTIEKLSGFSYDDCPF